MFAKICQTMRPGLWHELDLPCIITQLHWVYTCICTTRNCCHATVIVMGFFNALAATSSSLSLTSAAQCCNQAWWGVKGKYRTRLVHIMTRASLFNKLLLQNLICPHMTKINQKDSVVSFGVGNLKKFYFNWGWGWPSLTSAWNWATCSFTSILFCKEKLRLNRYGNWSGRWIVILFKLYMFFFACLNYSLCSNFCGFNFCAWVLPTKSESPRKIMCLWYFCRCQVVFLRSCISVLFLYIFISISKWNEVSQKTFPS